MKRRYKILISILSVFIILLITYKALSYACYYPKEPLIQKDKIKIACVGDSITYGLGVLLQRQEFSYPALLQKALGDEYQVLNYGLMARTLLNESDWPYLDHPFYQTTHAINPDIVIIMLGTNDAKSYNWENEQFAKQLETLVLSYQVLESSPQIYLMSAPPAFTVGNNQQPRYDIQSDILEYQVRIITQNVAFKTNSHFIDVFGILENHANYFIDGIHPYKQGNELISKAIYERINTSD